MQASKSSVMHDHDVMVVVPMMMMVVVNDHHVIGESSRRGECNGGDQQNRSKKLLQHRFILCFKGELQQCRSSDTLICGGSLTQAEWKNVAG
jgi:hypothetical protein